MLDKSFDEMAAANWVVLEPGCITWEGTSFMIQCEFSDKGMIYWCYHGGNKIAIGFSLAVAKKQIEIVAAEMIEMGYDL